VYINDHEPKIAARNFAMLTLLAKKGTSAIDSVIQFWYSSAVTSNQIFFLLKELSALVADTKRSSKYSKTTIHSLFDKNLWKSLGRMLTSRFSIYDADQSRRHVMLNPSRTDYLHRYMSGLKPGERVCCDNFRRYGLLLPFGALNAHLNVANRLIMDPDFGWTMTDSSDPLSGWDLKQVASTGKKYKVPPQDHYGALFFHIRDRLELFVKKLEKLTIEFHLTCMDACVLASDLSAENVVFDRIDVSNICDEQYVGIDRVLKSFCPLLNPKNSSAALTTLFMNWMREVPKHHINNTMIEIMKTFKKQKLNPMEIMAKATELATQAADEAAIKYNHTADFNKYIKKSDLLAASLGYKRRAVNKILPKRLYGSMQANKQDADLDMTAEDMHLVHVTMSTMFERFAEWEKA
jgi:hypothetical protein